MICTRTFLLFIFSILLYSCSQKPAEKIRIGILQGPSAISFVHFMDNAPSINGKQTEFVIKSDPQQIQAMLLKKELEFAILPTVMAANLYNKGLKYSMVACPVWGTLYIVSNQPTIQNIGDLAEKSISVFGQGATPDILLQYFLDKNNIDNIKIDYSLTNNNDLALALSARWIQTAVISEPMVSLLLSKNSDIHIVTKLTIQKYFDNSDKDIFVQSAFLVRNDFAENNPKLVRELCKAYAHSCNLLNENPELSARLLVKQKILPNEKVALASLPLCNIHYVAAFAIKPEIRKYLEIFLEFNPATIGGKIPDDNFVYQPQ